MILNCVLKVTHISCFLCLLFLACGGIRTDRVGVIQTPGYPQNYDEDLSCLFNVRVPLDRTIQVSFNSPFGITGGPYGNCSDDYLQVSIPRGNRLIIGILKSLSLHSVEVGSNSNFLFCVCGLKVSFFLVLKDQNLINKTE